MFVITSTAAVPVNIEQKTVNGIEYLVKTFETAATVNVESLVEPEFEEGGYSFRYMNYDRKENATESIKQASEITSLDTKTNSSSEILKMLSPSIGYSKEGYTGTLTLDTAGIVTAASGYGYRNVPVTKTREYPGLIYADPSYIPGSITENGVTLSLSGIEWVVTGTGLAGDTLVPTEYKAVATYSGSRRETYVTGYTTTAKYTGTVTKKTVESVTYTITYIGTLIPVPTTTAPTTEIPQETETLTTEPDETDIQETTEPDANDKEKTNAFNWLFPVVIAAIIIASLAAVVLLFLFHPKLKALLKNLLLKRSKIKASVYNLVDDEYVLLGSQPLDVKIPEIKLNEYDSVIKTTSFGFVLDKQSSKALREQIIVVIYNGEALTHRVTEISDEYKFKMVFRQLCENSEDSNQESSV